MPGPAWRDARTIHGRIKLKFHHEQEFVIGGFTDPEGSRHHFGSLIFGYYEKGALRCAGKVGTGFNDALLKSLAKRFESLASGDCPFKNLPEQKSGRYGAGITVAEMRRCHWLQPKLVCQLKYSEWTRDGKLRQPVFLGLGEDKHYFPAEFMGAVLTNGKGFYDPLVYVLECHRLGVPIARSIGSASSSGRQCSSAVLWSSNAFTIRRPASR